jgi:hypothetical protein
MCNNEQILSPLLTHSSRKYKQNFAIINGEGERDLTERQLVVEGQRVGGVVASSISRRSSEHVTGSSPSASTCLHSCARARPAGVYKSHCLATLVLPAGHRQKWS